MKEQLSETEKWQKHLSNVQNLMSYCKNIRRGIDELEPNSAERAVWELVQNARDMADNNNAYIKIILKNEKSTEDKESTYHIVFMHKGKPFDYTSLSALVKQTSSKDGKSDQAGMYGTGFMTTHAFSDIVTVNGAFECQSGKNKVDGYVRIKNFTINRSYTDLDEFIDEMSKELEKVDNLWKENKSDEPIEWTSFTYKLTQEQVADVSSQLMNAIRLMPFVLVLNDKIQECTIDNQYANKCVTYKKEGEPVKTPVGNNQKWQKVITTIKVNDNNTEREPEPLKCFSLQSVDCKNVVILPPFPNSCGNPESIPSLFLWFPLLGTEQFGVNFVFHSAKFFPVEKRNNIQLPYNNSKVEWKFSPNVEILLEMMQAVFDYYKETNNAAILSRDFARIHFGEDKEDPVKDDFRKKMQKNWVEQVKGWKIIPTKNGRKSMEDDNVKVLHPSFYQKLNDEQRKKYEPILAKMCAVENLILPSEDLIKWSEIIAEWNVGDDHYFIKPDRVCMSIVKKDTELLEFLRMMKIAGNDSCFTNYSLIPNREGILCKANAMVNGEFMTDSLYKLVKPLMGSEAAKMVDTDYLELFTFNEYKPEELKGAIMNTTGDWRKETTGANPKVLFKTNDPIDALICYCCANSTANPGNIRMRLMKYICKIYGKEFTINFQPKLMEKEEDMYASAFNFLSEYTLLTLSKKDSNWIKANKELLLDFLTEYTSSKNSDWIEKLDSYGIIPNQLNHLCIRKNLLKNVNIDPELAQIYQTVTGKDLKEGWVDDSYNGLLTFDEQKAEDIADEIQKQIEMALKEEDNKYDNILLQIIPKLTDNKWATLFDRINDKKETIVFKMKSGDDQKNLFVLMRLESNQLCRLAKLANKGNVEQLLNDLEDIRRQQEEQRQKFNFCNRIGKYIEDELRKYLQNDLLEAKTRKTQNEVLETSDIQNGQDIIIKYDNKEIYYIEVKAKWNFVVDYYAHMSINQMKMATKNADKYALCCVNLSSSSTANIPVDSTEEYVAAHIKDIIDNTKVHLNIGDELKDIMEPILEADADKSETKIRIGNYQANISRTAFLSGNNFNDLVEVIKQKIQKSYLGSFAN